MLSRQTDLPLSVVLVNVVLHSLQIIEIMAHSTAWLIGALTIARTTHHPSRRLK